MPKAKTVTKAQPVTATATKGKAAKDDDIDYSKFEKYGLSEDDVKELKEAFDIFDADKSGEVSTEEFTKALESYNINSNSSAIKQLMGEIDANKSGEIDFEEFVQMFAPKANSELNKENLGKIYDLFAGDSEQIGEEELTKVIEDIGETGITAKDIKEMIKRADSNGDDKVSFEEFYQFMNLKTASEEREEEN